MDEVLGIQGAPDGCSTSPNLVVESETITYTWNDGGRRVGWREYSGGTPHTQTASVYSCPIGGNKIYPAGVGKETHWPCYHSNCRWRAL
jgi:hypothetical protein